MKPARVILVCLLWCAGAAAQTYVISSYAGGASPVAAPVQGTGVSIGAPVRVATDEKGNVYFASPDLNAVFKLDAAGILTRIAGSSKPGYAGDGGPATNARMRLSFANASSVSSGLAVDTGGNVFIADTGNHCVRRISPSGIITTVAGTGAPGFSGDGGPAIEAKLASPWGVAVNGAGDLFILDTFNYRVRKVSAKGIIATLGSVSGWALAVDRESNVFVSSPPVRVLGNGAPAGITRISANGIVTTVEGVGGWGIAVDQQGALYVADGNANVQKISADGPVSTVAGNGRSGYSGDGGPAISAQLSYPSGVAVDNNGNLFIADRINYRIRKVSANGTIATVAGDGTGTFLADCSSSRYAVTANDGRAGSAQLRYPLGVAVDRDGNLLIADTADNRVSKVSPDGIITTVAGTGSCGFSGDGGPAVSAQLHGPVAVAVGSNGSVFIVDDGNHRIREVSSSGVIRTVAGDGNIGFAGDGGPAIKARFRFACGNTACGGVAVDSHGALFISDAGNNRIRRISPDGIITTVAGNGSDGFSGDGGQGTSAQLSIPRGLAVDGADNLFFAEEGRIRKVSPGGTITTVAGGIPFGTQWGFSGDGGLARSARLSFPVGVAVDSGGNLFIADPGTNFETGDAGDDFSVDQRIRKVTPDGNIITVAGNGSHDFSGDGGAAAAAAFNGATGVAVDGAGNVYVADTLNRVIRVMRPAKSSVVIGAVVDAATEHAGSVSPGQIVVIYGSGLGPSRLAPNQAVDGQFGTESGGTSVSFSGVRAPILYTSATQVAAVVPYAITGTTAEVTVAFEGQASATFVVPVAASAPGIFTLNQAGWGQAAAINAVDNRVNTAANPVKIGEYLSLYATGGGQTNPVSKDGTLSGAAPTRPILPVSVKVDGIPVTVQYAGSAPGQVAGLMQINVQIPSGVKPGGYVPVALQIGDRNSDTEVWIAVATSGRD